MFGATSCSDMLETDSTRMVSDPELKQKTDSMSYAKGVLQAMQELADQYYFQNEMRGELVSPSAKATINLRNLANFTAGAENKYDSVYLYYKVINNCNYYLQKRDTTLMTGTRNVTYNEFAAIAAFRAWAYLQMTTQYGSVPYVTEPMTTISQINASTKKTDYKEILKDQAEYLQTLKNKLSPEQLDVPVYDGYNIDVLMGHMNYANNANRYYVTRKCFVPLNVVLGDLYLEIGQYEDAAQCYFDYLKRQSQLDGMDGISNKWSNQRYSHDETFIDYPLDYNENQNLNNSVNSWDQTFNATPKGREEVSYIPMALNYTLGKTTDIPMAFGYDYYATSKERGSQISRYQLYGCPEKEDIQVVPSEEYMDMAFNAPYYYLTTENDPNSTNQRYLYSSVNIGDGRANMVVHGTDDKQDLIFVNKPSQGYIQLYRTSTVWMHLAEALNRLEMPQLAFAILKSGLHDGIKQYVDTAAYEYEGANIKLDADNNPVLKDKGIPVENYFIPKAFYDRLKTGKFPFLGEMEKVYFTNTGNKEIVGMHFHGAGAVENIRSTYTYKPVVEAKIKAIQEKFGVGTVNYTTEEYINAVEDLLCDEYALEFAFEGRRFSDLLRIARHKNESSPYGAAFGDKWLSDKLASKKAGITTTNCYLPFQ